MTGAAEIYRGGWIETARIHDRSLTLFHLTGLHGPHVSGAGAVTSLASDACNSLRWIEVIGGR